MLSKKHIKKYAKSAMILAFMILCISFVEKRSKEKECTKVNIKVSNKVENYFLSERDVLDLASARGRDLIVGGKLIHIPLKTMEKRIESNSFVESVQVDKDHQGNLNIRVRQTRPIARIFQGDTSFYIGRNKELLPLSKRYTSRVLVISGDGVTNYIDRYNKKTPIDSAFFAMLTFIDNSTFYKAQISEIAIGKDGEIVFQPQVTKQSITFGKPQDLEAKFEKLDVFYKTILPNKGWNSYNTVNVKFKDQIICE